MKKIQTEILEILDWKSVKEPNNFFLMKKLIIYKIKEKEYIKNIFKKEKESYLKDVKDKKENIIQLKELC